LPDEPTLALIYALLVDAAVLPDPEFPVLLAVASPDELGFFNLLLAKVGVFRVPSSEVTDLLSVLSFLPSLFNNPSYSIMSK
jgi:hypothetical protein